MHRIMLAAAELVRFFIVSEMTYTVSSGTLNSSIPYHTGCLKALSAQYRATGMYKLYTV